MTRCGVAGFKRRFWQLCHLLLLLGVHQCAARHGPESSQQPAEGGPRSALRGVVDPAYGNWRYAHTHNETRIAMAIAQATSDGDPARETVAGSSQSQPAGLFPGLWGAEAAPDGCNWQESMVWDLEMATAEWGAADIVGVQVLAVDACAARAVVILGYQMVQVSAERWRPHTDLGDGGARRRFFRVLVLVRLAEGVDILGEGVYYPATGTMHLVGCAPAEQIVRLRAAPTTPALRYVSVPSPELEVLGSATAEEGAPTPETWTPVARWEHALLNSSAVRSRQVCAIAATLQYPRHDARRNSQRKVKLSLRSTRGARDALYFDPVERERFHPYASRRRGVATQRLLETGARALALLAGVGLVAAQIVHGRRNEEALPFVSLAMVSIQIAHHVAQTSIFRDFQVGRPARRGLHIRNAGLKLKPTWSARPLFADAADVDYYGTMALYEHAPYQAMAMAAIFMYVWIFHRVSARRMVMHKRRLRAAAAAAAPPEPSDGGVALATAAVFSVVGYAAFCTSFLSAGSAYHEMRSGDAVFVSPRLLELSRALWGSVNNLTGLAVSWFLVPQVLGNWLWDVRGRPLSAFFYAGLPLLQSLPLGFAVAKHFELLPVLACFDPYLDSLYGVYEDPAPWLPMATMAATALLVLAVHLQFAKSAQAAADPCHA